MGVHPPACSRRGCLRTDHTHRWQVFGTVDDVFLTVETTVLLCDSIRAADGEAAFQARTGRKLNDTASSGGRASTT